GLQSAPSSLAPVSFGRPHPLAPSLFAVLTPCPPLVPERGAAVSSPSPVRDGVRGGAANRRRGGGPHPTHVRSASPRLPSRARPGRPRSPRQPAPRRRATKSGR